MRAALLSLLLLFPAPALAQQAATERADRDRITAFLEDNLSSSGREVVLEGFKGALSSRATATRLTIADAEGVWLTLNDIVLDWNRSALFLGQVSINELSAEEIIVSRAPVAESAVPSPEASGFALPELPVSVSIDSLKADRISLGEALLGQAVEARISASAQLSGGQGRASLDLERTGSGPAGRIVLDASYDNGSRRLSIALDASEAANGIAAELLTLPGRPSVEMIVNGGGPIDDFAMTIDLRSDEEERLKGLVTLKGNQQGATAFNADIGGDLAPLFLPEYETFFGPEISLRALGLREASGSLALEAFDLRSQSLSLKGSALVGGDGVPIRFAANGRLIDPNGQPVAIPGTEGVSLRAALLDIGYDATQSETWRANIAAEEVRSDAGSVPILDLRGSGRIVRRGADLHVGGTLSTVANGISLTNPSLQRAIGDVAELEGRFWWQQETDGLTLSDVRFAAGDLAGRFSAEVQGLSTGFAVSGSGSVEASDLSRLSGLAGRDLSGRGTISLEGEGSPLGGTFDARVQVAGQDVAISQKQIDDLLAGSSQISVDLRRDTTGTLLRSLDLRTTGLSVSGKGVITSSSADLDVDLVANDLRRLGPEYSGSAEGKIALTGPIGQGQAQLNLDLAMADLRLGVPQIDGVLQGNSNVTARAELNDQVVQIEQLKLTAQDLSVNISGSVSVQQNDVTARIALADLGRVLPGNGGGRVAADLAFSGTLQAAQMTVGATTQNLRVGQSEADRLLAGTSRLAASLRLEDGLVRIDDAQLTNPQVTVSATGRVGASDREIDLTARLANLALLLPDFPGVVSVQGTARERGNQYELSLAGRGPAGIDASVRGRVAADFSTVDLTVNGSAQAALANPFLGVRRVSGPVSMALRVSGAPRLQSVSGRISLTDGRLADPGLPFNFVGMNATATLSAGQARIDGSSQISTGGSITVGGTVGLSSPFNSALQIGLSALTIRDPELYQTRANGELSVTGPLAGGALISGRVALPETEVRVASTGLGGTGDLPDLRHVREPLDVRATRRRAGMIDDVGGGGNSAPTRPYALDLVISAPNRLFVRGRGLDAELGGELRVLGTTANVIPSGAFTLIRGRLDILGRRLDLSEASLQLEGDFDPELRIVASTEADGIVAGVLIEGRATDPQVTFTSSPDLPQEEVLAQILFGKRLESLSALQALQLANAVATLAGRGGEGIVSRLRRGFGLDDLDIQTAEDGSALLRAGKYISENVYTEVTVGDAGKTEINLNLDINKTLTLKGRVGSDGDTGIGLFFEKDY